jgi:hypothetical protein
VVVEAVGEELFGVRAIDDRTREGTALDVGDLVMWATFVAATDADHERDAPGVRAEVPVQLARAESVVPAISSGNLVQPSSRRQTERVRHRVEVVVLRPRAAATNAAITIRKVS